MDKMYDLLDDMIELYGQVNPKMTSLANVCQKLLACMDEETFKYPEIYALILKYTIKMYDIVIEETDCEVQKMGYEILSKLRKYL